MTLPVSPVRVLLVDDSDADVRLTREALKDSKLLLELEVASDGEQALAFLRGTGPWRPDLILLDLNLPRLDGRQVLAAIKADSALRTIPVVVLTTSQAEEDVLRCYELAANCFVTKPLELDQFLKVVGAIEGFWLAIVKLPVTGP